MSRTVFAFLWLRWRLTINALDGGRDRDLMASFAAWVGLLIRVLVGLFVLGAILTVGVVTGIVANALVRIDGLGPDLAIFGLRVVLGVLSLVLVVFPPLLSRSGGELVAVQRLRLLPVKERHLNLLDIAGGFADPWLLAITPVPPVMAGVLWSHGRVVWGSVALVAGFLMLVCLALAATAMRRSVSLVLRDRRRSETAALAVIVGVMVLSTASVWIEPLLEDAAAKPRVIVLKEGATEPPEVASEGSAGDSAEDSAGEAVEMLQAGGLELEDFARRFPLTLQLLPSELFAHALVAFLEGRTAVVAACLLALATLTVTLFVLARRLWRLTVGSPGISGRTRAGSRYVLGLDRLPGLSPAASAVAWAQITTALRSVAGKLALGIPALAMLVMVIPLQSALAAEHNRILDLFQGPQLALGGVALALLAVQPFALNQFAADGEGLARQLLLPLTPRDLVIGKAAGLGLLVGFSTLAAVLATAALVGRGSLGAWLAMLFTVLPAYWLMAPVSVFVSLYFPKAMDLGGFGSQSKPHQLATLIGLLALVVVVSPITLVVGLGLGLMGAPWWTAFAVLLLAAVSGVVGLIFLGLAAGLLPTRAEGILAAIRDK